MDRTMSSTDNDEAELDDVRLEELRVLLVEREAEARQGLEASTEDAKPVDLGLSIGRLSRVDAMQHQQVALARRKHMAVQQQQLRSALARVDAGTYGLCLECDEPIGYARLRARPETPLCRRCQQAREA